jgi:FkbM family methyltransferase
MLTHESATDSRPRFSGLLARKRNYRSEVKALTERYPHVVFYGCGAILGSIMETWNAQIGRKIDFCCDSDPAKWGQVFHGARCLSPAELREMRDTCTVFVTIGDFKPVYTQLKAWGFPSVHQLFKYDLLASEYLAQADEAVLLDQLCEAHALMGDERSRQVFEAIVTRVLGDGTDIDVMVRVCEGDQYFPKGLIEPSPQERLVDAGAYNGDTVRDFLRRTGGRFEHIYAFELDARNHQALADCAHNLPGGTRIQTFNLGIWDREAEISYSIGLTQSHVGNGEGRGRVVPLDQALAGEKITFIKMDIEGAEPQGLRGAADLIRSQRPTLAICIYHDFRHLWEIPTYLKSLVPGYRIYLRHHTNLEYETVCYALADPGPAHA